MLMTLLEMQYLVTIAKCKSLTKAANQLFVTQPTLSKFLAAQEKHYGMPFFTRTAGGYVPTFIGQRYVERASEILNLKHALDIEISELTEAQFGTISIGFTYMRIATTLSKVLPAFKASLPNVKVDITVSDSDKLEKMVLDGQLEVAFLPVPKKRDNLSYELIYREEILLAAPPAREYSSCFLDDSPSLYPYFDLRQLRDEIFILQPKWSQTRQIANTIFQENNIEPAQIMELENVGACLGLVSSDYGFGVVAESLIGISHLANEVPKFFSFYSPHSWCDYCAVYRKNTYISRYMRNFLDFTKEAHREFRQRVRPD